VTLNIRMVSRHGEAMASLIDVILNPRAGAAYLPYRLPRRQAVGT